MKATIVRAYTNDAIKVLEADTWEELSQLIPDKYQTDDYHIVF